MELVALGLNHRTASLSLREKVAASTGRLPESLRELKAGKSGEIALLSTCNRTEIYCGLGGETAPTAPDLVDHCQNWLADQCGLSGGHLAKHTYLHPDADAVRHAFRVAAGLDSMVIGEAQILGQMKQAFAAAQDAGTVGSVLNQLFQDSFAAAKQVRTDSGIGTGAVSVAYVAVRLARRLFADLSAQRVLLIGAGETMQLVAHYLHQSGVRQIRVANRSVTRAQALAERFGGQALELAQVPDCLAESDIVVTCTASTLPILGRGTIERAVRGCHRPLFMLDLALPRDIEPEVGKLPDVYLYSLEHLQQIVAENLDQRSASAEHAEGLIELRVARFMNWLRARSAVPAIQNLRGQLDTLREAELTRAKQRLNAGVPADQVLERLSVDLTNKFAHAPSVALNQAGQDDDQALLTAARRLLKL